MNVFEIVKAAYDAAPEDQKRFYEQLGPAVLRLEQAIGSYKRALKDVSRCVEYEENTLADGYMPSMIGLMSQAEKAMDFQREIKDLTDRIKNLMWGLGWSGEARDEMFEAIQALLAGK